ncbi:calcium-responsive transactivator isoform X5 [Bufo gargarizans]|uniref:calcium-responsive transactivator isoform X5 n=1 Tax=Bufo gargarizans TaxID=30331 RepID=UPI001CF4CEB9|nr:calcium-responsive transactivator isoform X5 [Bufo gargarizans]
MSVAFASARPRGKGEVTQQTIQKMLDENHHLIQCIMDYQSKGKTAECTQYQQILHRNLVYLATIADSNQNMQSLLPAPPTQSMNLGPGGMSQTGPSQGLHSQGNLSDALGATLPPSSLMQSQISNAVSMMHQQAASTHYTTAQGGGQHYQGQSSMSIMSQSNQGSTMMGQRPLGPYRSSQQGSAQQYLGQEEYYSEQYAHSQSSSESMGQQYYTDGHGDYAYQQSSYGEQSYDRTFDDSSQHYYEGAGNTQYSQQQSGYQQGTGQQQAYSQQQQYSNQQNYPGQQQQGYVPAQGSSSQYSTYQQGQSQPYTSYRAPQTASSAQQQRPYGYEQGQYGNYQQ